MNNNNDNYIKFEPSNTPIYNNGGEDKLYLFNDDKLLVRIEDYKYIIPEKKVIEKEKLDINYLQVLGAYKGINCYSGEVHKLPDSEGYEFIDLRTYSTYTSEENFLISAKARLLHNYTKENKRCGVCGSTMTEKEDEEKSRYCLNCYNTIWPQTSPAIIVAVTKGDKLLLAHNKLYPKGRYSVLAGFVEMGETLEDCVRREVFEETGIKVHNIEYFGSQPWPFPNSMMIGFTAEYLEGDIEVDKVEIMHAEWFTREEVLEKHKKSISISSKLIESFLDK